MASRHLPDAFATALTGVYATDPDYGPNLIALMRLYHLYRYDSATPAAAAAAGAPAAAAAQRACPRGRGRGPAGGVPGVPDRGTGRGGGIPGVAGALAVGAVRARAARSGRSGSGSRGGGRRTGAGGPDAAERRGRSWAAAGAADRAAGFADAARRYVPRIPYPVAADFAATAKGPLTRAQPLYQDVASRTGIGWELLAACDWMQCQARPRYSPVHGEKLGTVNPDGTVFRTR